MGQVLELRSAVIGKVNEIILPNISNEHISLYKKRLIEFQKNNLNKCQIKEICNMFNSIIYYDEATFWNKISRVTNEFPIKCFFDKKVDFSSNSMLTNKYCDKNNEIIIEIENINKLTSDYTLVFLDDFSGTGTQIKEQISKIQERNTEIKIIVISYCLTDVSEKNLTELGIDIFYCEKLNIYNIQEECLSSLNKKMSYKEKFVQNTLFINGIQSPNNNVPLMWKKTYEWIPLFKRKVVYIYKLKPLIKKDLEYYEKDLDSYGLSLDECIDFVLYKNNKSLFEKDRQNELNILEDKFDSNIKSSLDTVIKKYNSSCRNVVV